ncbi:hypothetical protein I4F81_001221 [Pyropia yezoensis]|uniref:Uncharacterized protein n=1 Tax=Pyropia yezoensis TaxID=2788 RepID=A0ACC3BLJ6_PYRYE|nr:hypothetical protein I4F81_001221 [Neopyropia yezoensis]
MGAMRRTWVRAAVAAIAAAIGAAVVVPPPAAAQVPPPGTDLTDFIDRKREVTATLAREARAALLGEGRCARLSTCGDPGQCSYFSCGWEFDNKLTCTARAPNPAAGCGGDQCKAIRLATTVSFVRVPPSTLLSTTDGLVPAAEYEEVCLLRVLDSTFIRSKADTVPWAFVSTANGVHRIYPGQRREHTGPNGECRPYDPRLRPWYASAASGPLDVAIVVDRSAEMGRAQPGGGTGGQTVMDVVTATADGLLGTLDWSSYVGVVRYNDAPQVLGGFTAFVRATRENLDLLQVQVKKLTPGGGTDVAAALDAGITLFRTSADRGATTNCTRVLFLLTGSDDSCLSECGRGSVEPCTCTSTTLQKVRTRLAALADENPPLTVIVLAFGGVDEGFARQLTCGGAVNSQGLTVTISDPSGNPVSGVAPAYRWLSTARRNTEPVAQNVFFSENYTDDAGFGDLTTAALPIYDNAGRLLAVSAVDIPIAELRRRSPSVQALVDELAKKKATCSLPRLSSCEQQLLRQDEGACAEQLPAGSGPCYEAARGVGLAERVAWVPFLNTSGALSHAAAAAACAALTSAGTGRLAIVREEADAAALASILGEDLTWLGASRPATGGPFTWPVPADGSSPVTYKGGWPGELVPPMGATGAPQRNCVAADRRGVRANWVAVDCARRAPYVCEFPLSAASPPAAELPTVCNGSVTPLTAPTTPLGDRVNPPVEACPPPGNTTTECPPVPVRRRKPFCPLGTGDDDCEGRCCPNCNCLFPSGRGNVPDNSGDGKLSGGAIAGVVVGVVAGLSVVAAVGWFFLPWAVGWWGSARRRPGAAAGRQTPSLASGGSSQEGDGRVASVPPGEVFPGP